MVLSYPGELPLFRKAYVEGRPDGMTKGSDWLAQLRPIAERYGPLPPPSSDDDGRYFEERAALLRLELTHRTAEVRRELLPPPA